MARTLFTITRILLVIAWLFLLRCMFLPQIYVSFPGQAQGPLLGSWVALTVFVPGLYMLSSLNTSAEKIFILAIILSDLLFLVSPLILIRLRAGNLIDPIIYWSLNIVCMLLFILLTPQIFYPPNFQNHGMMELRPLPNLFLWLTAQTILTLAVTTKIIGRYAIRYQA
jgi:hypothetical protein